MTRPRLFLIDSFGFIFRAYHARARSGAPPMRTTSGLSTEATFIFHNMLRKLREFSFKPRDICHVFGECFLGAQLRPFPVRVHFPVFFAARFMK